MIQTTDGHLLRPSLAGGMILVSHQDYENHGHCVLPSVIGCDLGGSKLSAAVFTPDLVRRSPVYRNISGLDYAAVIAAVVDTVAKLATAHPEVAAVGLAVAGQVDALTGTVSHRAIEAGAQETHVASLPVQKFELATLIADRVGRLPIVVENDGNAAVLAEWRSGAARGADYVVCLAVGTYLGSGVVNGGRVVRRRTSGPLLGGTLWIDPSDPYGLRHLGEMVGGHEVEVIAARTVQQNSSDMPWTAEVVAEHARRGNQAARAAFARVAATLHIAILDAANVWDPEVIVLAGGLMGVADLLLEGLPTFMERWRLPGADAAGPAVRVARFGADAGLVGAAIGAFDALEIAITEGGRDSS